MSKRAPITWTDCVVRLGDLKPWADNPKTTSKKDARKLIESLDELGQFQNVSIGPDNEVFDGHQRLSAWLTIYGPGFEVAARRASRPLTDEERRMIAIYSRQIGAWDWDKLANWDSEQLVSWGMDGDFLHTINTDAAGLRELLYSSGEMQIPEDEWKGMPEFENNEIGTPELTIKVHFQTVDDIRAFSELIGQTVTEKSTYIWFPKQQNENLKKFRCKDES